MPVNSSFYQMFRKFMSAAIVLGLVGFAVYSLAASPAWFKPASPTATLAGADDPVFNGLRIIETPHFRQAQPRTISADPSAVVLLDEWTYTGGKVKPSPYK